MTTNPQTLCRTCMTPIGYVDCPTGGWWAHEQHPADEHDAVPGAWVDGDELMEAIAAVVWEHCAGEGTSLIVDDPRNIAGTAAAVARHLPAQPAAVSVPPPTRADDRAALRDRIAAAIWERQNPGRRYKDCEYRWQADAEADADAVLAVLPPPADRTAVLLEAADIAEDVAESLRKHHEFERSTGALDVMTELRRLAAEAQPEAPWATDGARIGRALIWSWARVGDTDFGRGYRTAQEDVRAILTRPLLGAGTQQQPDTETEAHPPEHAWKVESPRRDTWASWGATYDDRDWALERYESAVEHAPGRPFRLVRATTAYTVEAEHQPAAEAQPVEPHPTEADLRHALAVLDAFQGRDAGAPDVEAQTVQHAPGIAVRCPDCRAKGYSVCMTDDVQHAADDTSEEAGA